MCLAGNYLSQFQEISVNLNNHFTQLSEANSKLDREISVLYHEIEKMDLTHESSYHVCSLLQSTLKKRRIVKEEFRRLGSLRSLMEPLDSKVKEAEKRYSKAFERSEETQRSLNVTLTIEEIGVLNV